MSKKPTIITIAMLAALATPVLAADRQASDDAANNDLSWQVARGTGGGAFASVRAPRDINGAFASSRAGNVRVVPAHDFQLDGGRN